MSKKRNSRIRNQIIIPVTHSMRDLDKYSNVELAALFSNNKINFEIFITLLEQNKRNVNLINEMLMETIINESTTSIDTIKLLIEYGADINYRSPLGSTPLLRCSFHQINKIKTIELLIQSGANVNSENNYQETSLMILAENSMNYHDLEKIKLLIRKGSKINYQNKYGQTPLMYGVLSNNIRIFDLFDLLFDIIKLLLDNKADTYIKNKKGKNIFDIVKDTIGENSNIYSLIFNYKNLENDHLCESDINFIYNYSWYL